MIAAACINPSQPVAMNSRTYMITFATSH